jgi:F-type H+-transporting ATPase subunit b
MQIHLTPDISLLVIMLIFLANYFVVRKYFFQPVNAILTERETEVRSAEAGYEQSLARFREATENLETRVQQARREGSAVREQHRAEASGRRAEIIDRTRAEADEITAEANQQIGADVAVARERIVVESEQLARAAAEMIIGRKIK